MRGYDRNTAPVEPVDAVAVNVMPSMKDDAVAIVPLMAPDTEAGTTRWFGRFDAVASVMLAEAAPNTCTQM